MEEKDEPVEKIVDVPREHEIEEIHEEEAPLDPQLCSPQQSRLQDTPPDTPPRRSPRIKNQQVTQQNPPMPLEQDAGTQCKAVRLETPHNPSTERNKGISRKLILHTPSGRNPQPSTLTGGNNPKTVPAKCRPKTHGRGHGAARTGRCGHGRGAPPRVVLLLVLELV